MKRSIGILVVCFIIAVLVACSKYTYYAVGNNNISHYRTFAWLPPLKDNPGTASSTTASYYHNDIADQKITDQATANLESRGLVLNSNKPDLLVRYTVMVNREVRTYYNAPVYNYYWDGFYPHYRFYRGGRGFYWGHRGPYPIYVGNDIEKVPYKEGTLIIDLIDRKSGKVIWRGYAQGEVTDPQSAINDLPEIVNGIFNKLSLQKTR